MCQLRAKQAQAVATAASCPCYQGSCSPLAATGASANASYLPALRPPRGHAGTLAHCEARGDAHSEHGRRFKALCRNAPQCLATLLMNTATAANAIVWHSSKTPARQHRIKQMHRSWWGRQNPTTWISQKAKAWRKCNGSGHFTRYLSIAVALKSPVRVCDCPHSPSPHLPSNVICVIEQVRHIFC